MSLPPSSLPPRRSRPTRSHLRPGMPLLLLAAFALCSAPPARAQTPGQWWPRWTRCEPSGGPPASAYPPDSLTGTLTGSCTLTGTYADMLAYSVSRDPLAPDYDQPYPHRDWASFQPNPFYAPDAWLFPDLLLPGAPTSKAYGESSSGDPQHGALIDIWTGGSFYHDATGTAAAVPYPGVDIVGTADSKVSVALVAYFKWDPYYSSHDGGYGSTPPPDAPPAPPAPDHLDLLLTTGLSAKASVDYSSSGLTSGLRAWATATDQVNGQGFNETASASAGDAGLVTGVPVVGHHLVRAAVSGGIAEVYLNAATEASGADPIAAGVVDTSWGHTTYRLTAGWTEATARTEVTASAVPDSREVAISSPIEASYYKGPFDILRGTTQYTHQRDPATGAISVDSAVVWKNASQGGLGGVAGVNKGWYADHIPLTANMSNFINPFLSWTLLGMTSPDASLDIAINPVHFSLYEGDTVKFPLSSTVRADVTDSDGAVTANTYGMTWHLPFEKNQLISTSYTRKKHGASRVAEVYPGETKMRMPVPPEKIGLSAALDAGAAVTKGLGDEKDSALFEIAAKFAELAHLEYEFPGEEGDKDVSTGAANTPGSGNWGFARGDMDEKYAIVGGDSNIPDALKDDPANQALCKMSWWVVEKDKTESWYADGYNANGYDGNSQHVVTETHVEGMEDQAFFEQYKTPDGTLL